MPLPLSRIRISLQPPFSNAIAMRVAPTSRRFSTSSLTTEAGRSTTSPAAIWLASKGGRIRIGILAGGDIEHLPDQQLLRFQTVVVTQLAFGHAITLCQTGETLAVAHHVANRASPIFAGRRLAGNAGAFRWILGIVTPHAAEDGGGNLALVSTRGELLLLQMVRDEARFNQQGGNIRCLEDCQTGMHRLGLVQPRYPTDLGENLLTNAIAFTARVIPREIQNGLRQIGVGFGLGDHLTRAAEQLGVFVLLAQQLVHLAIHPFVGEDPD